MGAFIRLVDYDNAERKISEFNVINNAYRINQSNFMKVPGSPIAYWVTESFYRAFDSKEKVGDLTISDGQTKTGDNALYLRLIWEVDRSKIGPSKKWVLHPKGGTYRKWYGNVDALIDWSLGARNHYRSDHVARILPEYLWWKIGVCWTMITMGKKSFRYVKSDEIFNLAAPTLFFRNDTDAPGIIAFLNSKVADHMVTVLNPTINMNVGEIQSLPLMAGIPARINTCAKRAISIERADWDMIETSHDFLRSPLLTEYSDSQNEITMDCNLSVLNWPSVYDMRRTIDLTIQVNSYKANWRRLFLELHEIEESSNQVFIHLYKLGAELNNSVSYNEITILQDQLIASDLNEGRVEFDEVVLAQQFLSYGVGCLMGRYSVEQDGLILADAGATIEDFKSKIPNARFLPDADGILPLTDEDDFSDDLPTAFKSWLRFISGSHYDDNLRWMEDRLGKDLRSFFDRDFYKDHIRRYKSRPIYWMVSSPSGAFRALLYLHRYTKDTVGKILNDYVRPYRTKIDQKIRGLESIIDSSGSSAGEKTKAKKRLAQLEKYRIEIEAWEKESLYPQALKRVELDLDDGVKVNYRKLEGILEPVKQLEAKEEE